MSKTEPANAKGIVQAHVLQALKTFSDQNTGRQSWLGYGGCSFVPIDM